MAAKADRAADKTRYQRMAAAWKRLASVDAWLERHKAEIMGDAGSAGSPGVCMAAPPGPLLKAP